MASQAVEAEPEQTSPPCTSDSSTEEQVQTDQDVQEEAQQSDSDLQKAQPSPHSPVAEGEDFFQRLDDETIIRIFSFLNVRDLVSVSEVSHDFNELACSDELWIALYEGYPWKYYVTCNSENLELDWRELFVARYLHETDGEGDDPGSIEQFCDSDDDDDDEDEEGLELQRGYMEGIDSIEDVFRTDGFRLEELLSLNEFMSELHRSRPVLLRFLKQPSTMAELISLVLSDLDPDEPDVKQRKKIAHTAFQAVNNDWLLEVLIAVPELLDDLLSFLKTKTEATEPLKSGYFAKIMEVLLERYPNELVEYLLTKEDFAPTLITHVQDQYIMDTLYKLVDCPIAHKWFHDSNFIVLLIAHLNNTFDQEEEEETSQVLYNIFTLCQHWAQAIFITDLFNNEDVVTNFLAYITRTPDEDCFRFKNGLSAIIAMLALLAEDALIDEPLFVTELAEHVQFFLDKLLDPPAGIVSQCKTTFGLVKTPFSSIRLKVLEFFSAVLYTGYTNIMTKCSDLDVFNHCLDLLFKYEHCSICHHHVDQIFVNVLSGNDDDLIVAILEKCQLPERISGAFHGWTDADNHSVSYLGHLLHLANELVNVAKYSTTVNSYLFANQVWSEFTSGSFLELNERENVPLGGAMPLWDGDDYLSDLDGDGPYSAYYYDDDDDDNEDDYDDVCVELEEDELDSDEDSEGELDLADLEELRIHNDDDDNNEQGQEQEQEQGNQDDQDNQGQDEA